MGYRLEVSSVVYSDCGGKLFGYISDEEMHNCKSWQWLKNKELLTEYNQDLWDYGIPHTVRLWHNDFEEFIKLYIEDYNKYSPYHNTLSLDDFKKSLSADEVIIEWC